jgi:hypothetical protein
MIDLETLATHPNAIILTIGCIKFDLDGQPATSRDILEDGERSFYRRITISSCEDIGLEKENSTVEWWSKQSYEMRKEVGLTDEKPLFASHIKNVLSDLNKWIGRSDYIVGRADSRARDASDYIVWCNGASFDFPILTNAYRKCRLIPFWKFWNERDCRTVFALHKKQLKNYTGNDAHNALLDCYHQIRCLNDCLN